MGTTAFDLISRPDAIHAPWGFLAIFWLAGLVIISIVALAWHFRWKRWRRVFFTVFAVVWCSLVGWSSWTELNVAHAARQAARNRSFLTVEGCLSTFHAGKPYASKTIDVDEAWTLGGERFEYGAGGVGFAYRLVEPLGGSIHPDTRVKVAFIRNEAYNRNEILRLVVEQHVCPHAPDPGPP